MKRIIIKRLANGQYAQVAKNGNYYPSTMADTEHESRIIALKEIGHEAQRTIDWVQSQLKDMNAVDTMDPYGWLA